MRSATNLARIKDIRSEDKILFVTPKRMRPLPGTAHARYMEGSYNKDL